MTVTDAQLKQLVDAMARWRGTDNLGAKEVIAWRTGRKGPQSIRLAFRGDALRIKRNLLSSPMRNPVYDRRRHVGMLDDDMARALGLDDLGQVFTTDDVYPFDFLNGVGIAATAYLNAIGVSGYELVAATLMPKEGEPWVYGSKSTTYVSSKKKKPTTVKPPPLIDIDERQAASYDMAIPVGIDPCLVADRIESCGSDALVGVIPDRRGEVPFIVTHSFDVAIPRFEDAAERIAACRGLAYPSLAVGAVSAANFGQVALIADIGLVLQALKPYRGRGRWPIVLYRTDAWTTTSRQVFTQGAHELFVELTGQPTNWTYKDDFWTLGAPVEEHKADLISNTKALRTELKRRYKAWPRELDIEGIEERMAEAIRQEAIGHMVAPGQYPYLEAKANGIVPLSCFPLAVCPSGLSRQAHAFLSTAGFQGVLAEVDFPAFSEDPTGYERDGRDLRWDYGWAVRDAVEEFAAEHHLFGAVAI